MPLALCQEDHGGSTSACARASRTGGRHSHWTSAFPSSSTTPQTASCCNCCCYNVDVVMVVVVVVVVFVVVVVVGCHGATAKLQQIERSMLDV